MLTNAEGHTIIEKAPPHYIARKGAGAAGTESWRKPVLAAVFGSASERRCFTFPTFAKKGGESSMPITITFHIWGITVSIKLSMTKTEQKVKKQNRHSAK